MRPKSIVLLILALGCGLIASIGINEALKQPAQAVVLGETLPIFVASEVLNIGDPIAPQKVALEEWPKDKVPQGAFTKLEDLEGRRAKSKLFKGEPLLEVKLFGKGESGAGLLDDIPPGMRMATVKVDSESGGAGLLKPGDHVDLIVHVVENRAKQIDKDETISPKDLRNLKILAIDSIHSRDGNGEQAIVAKTISLLATPEQANLITLARNLGTISLIGRNARDTVDDETDGAVDFNRLKNGLNSSSAPAKGGIAAAIEKFLPPPQPEVSVTPPPQVPIVATVPDVKRDTMIIREGPAARQVIFENGIPLELTDGHSGDASQPPVESEPPREDATTQSVRPMTFKHFPRP